ncbi:hypothetical protein HMP0721_1103 [Pseudoramibacter alactolyticus ATCC 23263]|uniref:Uncharacterized protein n=1 Tax=Pseudoramibacter alactolyticus ATCC 23263 TaxID=887929 RepID=E6MGH0_9FIRM|nr:hypothetical protein HMP0721_1103 [Pseudoramibacter alactolyticus ATCC 23263]
MRHGPFLLRPFASALIYVIIEIENEFLSGFLCMGGKDGQSRCPGWRSLSKI